MGVLNTWSRGCPRSCCLYVGYVLAGLSCLASVGEEALGSARMEEIEGGEMVGGVPLPLRGEGEGEGRRIVGRSDWEGAKNKLIKKYF